MKNNEEYAYVIDFRKVYQVMREQLPSDAVLCFLVKDVVWDELKNNTLDVISDNGQLPVELRFGFKSTPILNASNGERPV